MITGDDLPRERFGRRPQPTPATLQTRNLVDAWFTLLALPASYWVSWVRQAHGEVRKRL